LKTCLPDINVWIALASDRHVHHDAAKNWFAEIDSGEAAFCRVTQMGFLRLITNRHVMGTDVVTQKEAWQVYQKLSRDQRVTFLLEPPGIEYEWRRLTQSGSASTNTWPDAYLAAFAGRRSLKIVSFDSGFEKLPGADAIIL
jgi:toxin-antitoxin system PIN domain toxin